MSLLRLKSIFQKEAKLRSEDYNDSISKHMGDSKITPPTFSVPVLNSILRKPSSFISDDLIIKKYNLEVFGSNTYKGSIYDPAKDIPDNFSPSNNISTNGWEDLYTAGHGVKDGVGYNYGGNVNRDKLDIKNNNSKTGLFTFSRTPILGMLGEAFGFGEAGEPYVVSRIPKSATDVLSGRTIQMGDRSVPIVRSAVDTYRVASFMTSPAGVAFLLKQNVNAFVGTSVVKLKKTGNQTTGTADENGLYRVPQRFNKFYNPLSTLSTLSPLNRFLGQSISGTLYRRDEPSISSLVSNVASNFTSGEDFLGFGSYGTLNQSGINHKINDTFTNGLPVNTGNNVLDGLSAASLKLPKGLSIDIGGVTSVSKVSYGDKMTLAPMIKGKSLDEIDGQGTTGTNDSKNQLGFNVEDEKEGMPLYFKDLRDNTYVFFRAFIEGITENISPNWNPTNYVGRSEPVYIYERSERDMSFTLNLFAHTKQELSKIYEKLNRLTSMCYPEYAVDELLSSQIGNGIQKSRMKPPLIKFRMGEMFGSENNEVLGFIKSVSYTIPESSTWETDKGKRVPKQIQASLSYQILHNSVPRLKADDGTDFKFYGYTGD